MPNHFLSRLIKKFAKSYPLVSDKPFYHDKISRILTEEAVRATYENLNISPDEYEVRGSIGRGRRVDIPWLAIMHKGVTLSPQEGYYIVILFSQNMEHIWVALGLGWTQFVEMYGGKSARTYIRNVADILFDKIQANESDKHGKINLGAKSDRGRGFELSNIVARRFEIDNLSENRLVECVKEYLVLYRQLRDKYGADILYDDIVSDEVVSEEFKNRVTKLVKRYSVEVDKGVALVELGEVLKDEPIGRRIFFVNQILRNRAFSNFVKKRAGFVCEVCGRKPFRKASGGLYAEADHIKPLSKQGADHVDNMRCVCALCHRIVTYGSEDERRRLLNASRISKT